MPTYVGPRTCFCGHVMKCNIYVSTKRATRLCRKCGRLLHWHVEGGALVPYVPKPREPKQPEQSLTLEESR